MAKKIQTVTRSEIEYAIELLRAPGRGEAEAETLRILARDMPAEHARRVMRAAIAESA